MRKLPKSAVQAIMFMRTKYKGTKKCKAWLEQHGYKPIKPVHITKNFYQYCINDPKKYTDF